MLKSKEKPLSWSAFLFCLAIHFFRLFLISSADEEINDRSQLAKILDRVASYCDMFTKASLHYICLEEINEIVYSPYLKAPRFFDDGPVKTQKRQYLYDYQLIQKGREAKEQRILLEENGVKMRINDAPLKVQRFQYKYIILGPLLLGEYWQQFHDYRIIGQEKVRKEPCLVIEAVPKPGLKLAHLYGKIWVSSRDYRVWKLEWYQESIDNYELIEETAERLKAKPQVKLTLELAFEKKGIRFPSQYVESEEYVGQKGLLFIKSQTRVNYKSYKFFIVETEVELKK